MQSHVQYLYFDIKTTMKNLFILVPETVLLEEELFGHTRTARSLPFAWETGQDPAPGPHQTLVTSEDPSPCAPATPPSPKLLLPG